RIDLFAHAADGDGTAGAALARVARHARDALLELEQRFDVALELFALELPEQALHRFELGGVHLVNAAIDLAGDVRGRIRRGRARVRRRCRGHAEGDAAEDLLERLVRIRIVGHGLPRAAVRDDVALVGEPAIGRAEVDARDGRAPANVGLLEQDLIDGGTVRVARGVVDEARSREELR